ncbi:MAG: DNA/RNA nuclease SfsA [Oscillospiraceae bacterium]
MKYEGIRRAVFLDRPNRFIANIELDGKQVVCHVKNTGRCRELLIPGTEIYVQQCTNPNRRTKFDLITVRKGDRLINIDSAAPNKVFAEWIGSSGFFDGVTLIRPETRYGDSRLDYYIEASNRRIFCEVKGVTLEEEGVVRFPDAPTQRGVKHLRELIRCKKAGFEPYAVFVIQMDGVRYFTPNWDTHPEFGRALCEAQDAGVGLIAFQCQVSSDSILPSSPVQIRL